MGASRQDNHADLDQQAARIRRHDDALARRTNDDRYEQRRLVGPRHQVAAATGDPWAATKRSPLPAQRGCQGVTPPRHPHHDPADFGWDLLYARRAHLDGAPAGRRPRRPVALPARLKVPLTDARAAVEQRRVTRLALSPACLRGGRCVLRSSAGPEDLDRHPDGCGPGVDQIERDVRAGVREQARALADDHGERQQVDLVDQLVFEQPAHQGAASVYLQLTARLGLQLADRCDLPGDDGRLRPSAAR